MQIRAMNATFGKLERAELRLEPGLNVIYAPNESGKSTWCSFIRNMLYGVNTRDRGPDAEKNRYAPWVGAPMRGRMDLTAAGADYTLTRETRRAGAPMGEFSCVYAGTVTPVPGLTGQNAGETLLGVSREVFERSAFIGQAALAVDQDAELERRIAALITTGEEDTSYSEAYDRLKKQLNRRRHNKTGQIPALEREIGQLDDNLSHLAQLQEQYALAAGQADQIRTQLADLREQERRWELLARRAQWDEYREAERAAEAARQRADTMAELTGPLPDGGLLSRMELRSAALSADRQEAERAEQEADQVAGKARESDQACRSHPLYPADQQGLQDRLEHFVLPEVPGPLPFWISLALAALCAAVAVWAFLTHRNPAALAAAVCCLAASAFAVIWRFRRRRAQQRRHQAVRAKEDLTRQAEEYLPLRQEARETADAACRAEGLRDALRRRYEEGVSALLLQLSPYRAAADLPAAAAAICEIRRQADALIAAEQTARDAEMRRDLLRRQLPEEEPDREIPAAPAMSRSQVLAALPQAEANLRAVQSRLDTLAGQIRSMGDPDDLIARRGQMREELERLQGEYDAVALAMDALDSANLTLQNRFSPALGARAAEIFSAITGGKYHKVLLSRDFSLAAEPSDDSTARSVRLLSQGAADQLYLSVRLAICDMVLPRDRAVPLILDDALVSFDDDRLRAALDYLLKESENRQILLFTCQKREQAYLAGRENAALLTL